MHHDLIGYTSLAKLLATSLVWTAIAFAASSDAGAATLEGSVVTTAGYCCSGTTEADRLTNFASAIVGLEAEFPLGSITTIGSLTLIPVEIDVGSQVVAFSFTGSAVTTSGAFNGYVFTFSNAPAILDVLLNPLSSPLPVNITHTDDSIAVSAAGLAITAGDRLILDVTTASIPEPTLLGLLALSGIAFRVARRPVRLIRS